MKSDASRSRKPLFDMNADPAEQHDLSAKRPEKLT
jgi:hypothetical protein